MRIAVFPGSFDPITNGHIDVIRRSLKIFDRVVVGVLHNPGKSTLLSVGERVALIEHEFKRSKGRVHATSFSGLLVDFLRERKAPVVIRGLRAISDYDYETQMALANKTLWPEVETVFLVAREENSYISSSIVRQIALFGGDISKFVPEHVAKIVRAKCALLPSPKAGRKRKKF